MTKQWTNGVYNFNSNFIKNIPNADMIVNKIIRNFFTINPLSYNRYGKKSKLLSRRYKRLSLNRILASKPEIKHDNNKVNITVYLFNKKKNSLLKALNTKKNNMSKGKKVIDFSWTSQNNSLASSSKSNYKKTAYRYTLNKQIRNLFLKKIKKIVKYIKHNYRKPGKRRFRLKVDKNALPNLRFIKFIKQMMDNLNSLGIRPINYNYFKSTIYKRYFGAKEFVIKRYLFNKWLFNNKFIFSKKRYYSFLKNKSKKQHIYNNSLGISRIGNKLNKKNNFYYYKPVLKISNNVGGSASRKHFFVPTQDKDINTSNVGFKPNAKMLDLKQNEERKYNLKHLYYRAGKAIKIVLRNHYVISNKYKLLSKHEYVHIDKNIITLLTNNSIKVNNIKSIYKSLVSFDKGNSSKVSKLLINIGKSLDRSMKNKLKIKSVFRNTGVKKPKKYLLASSIRKVNQDVLKIMYPGKKVKDSKKIYLSSALTKMNKTMSNLIFSKSKSLKKNKIAYQHSVIMKYNTFIMKKIEKIEKFIKRYSKTLYNENYKNVSKITLNNINNLYKSMCIKDILHKETSYLHYVKLLSYNNALFKSWLLIPLKNIISKLYNKKIILNLVNLKYIHLDSDILLQAMALKLRNIKKNRLNKVLRKTLSLVKISKVNSNIKNIHHPVYRYIEQHFDKFKHLDRSIFNDINNNNNDKKTPVLSSSSYNTTSTKWLDYTQANTINFIKYKSVFGLKLEASGRLTKRSTASRSIFKFRYKGGLKNNSDISRINSSTVIKSNIISNLQYSKISSKTRNGSFGIKSWINNN